MDHRTSSERRRGPAVAAITAVALLLGVLAAPPAASAVAPPNLWVDALELDFGKINNGLDSVSRTVTVHNTGPGTATGLTLSAPTSNQFEQTATTCGSSLAVGATCTITYRYSPEGGVLRAQGLAAVNATGGASVAIRLSGAPHIQPLSLRITPLGLNFGATAVGGTSATQSVVITNVAGSNAVFTLNGSNTAPTPPAPFSTPATTCTSATSTITLAAGASCTINYRFRPTTAGEVTRTLDLVVNQSGIVIRTYKLNFRGFGGTTDNFPIKVNPTALDFGPVAVGATAPAQNVTFTNTSAAPRTIEYTGGGSGTFGGVQSCAGTTLAPGASCTATYAAAPTVLGYEAEQVDIGIEVDGFPEKVTPILLMVNGTGSVARADVNPRRINLGPSAIGVPTESFAIRLTNSGTATLTGISIAQSGTPVPEFTSIGLTCGSALPAGGTCTYNVRYTPTTAAQKVVYYVVSTSAGDIEVRVEGGPRASVHEAFIRWSVAVFLGRSASAGELTSGGAALDAGTTTRRAYITDLAGSEEWVERVVQDLYQDTLGRDGDPSGVTFWVNRIRTGRYTVAQVAAEFYASNEYYVGIGGGTDTSWVTDLYVKLLGRTPDSSGLAYWVGQTGSRGRVNVAGRMFQSPESRRARVTSLYQYLLFRSPDTAGRDYWAGRIETEGDLALAIELASSTEFLRLAQRLDGDLG